MNPYRDDPRRPSPARLYRDPDDGWLAGVCAGIAGYFGLKTWLVRAITVACLVFFFVPTALAYLIAALVLPKAPERLYRDESDAVFWQGVRTDPRRTFDDLRHRFRELDHRLQRLETHVTSPGFRLKREIDRL